MSGERPVEMLLLPDKLRSLFGNTLPQATSGTAEQRERNFLSRALAAFAIHKLSGCTAEEAASAIVDGGGDWGIDAIHYSPLSNTIWVVQSKYIDSGRGEPTLGDVSKFKNGIESLLQGQFAAFQANPLWMARIPEIERWFDAAVLRVRAILVYSGIANVSEDRRLLFEDVTRRFSFSDDYFGFAPYNLTSIGDWLTGTDEGRGVREVSLELYFPGYLRSPYETIYGLVRLNDILSLHTTHGRRLIAANIRSYQGATEVNSRIVATLKDEPHHFFYLNNGLTAYCERFEVNNLDRANPERKRVKAKGFSIINGAQTLWALQECWRTDPALLPDGFVFLKLVSLERCVNDEEFAKRITESTNFQNHIGVRDFVSLDQRQQEIALYLRQFNIDYFYKSDAEAPEPSDTNLNLIEATTALACLEQELSCDLCSRVLNNRNSLWSMETVYPEGDLHRTRYHRLFRPDRSVRTLWRAVQVQRCVVEQMRASMRSAVGLRKAFFENARWLVLNLVFLRLHPERGEAMMLSEDELSQVVVQTDEIAEALWSVCETFGYVGRRSDVVGDVYDQPRQFRSVFSSSADCERLRSATMSKLAR